MWPNTQFPADLVTFTEEIFKEKRHFMRSVFLCKIWSSLQMLLVIFNEIFSDLSCDKIC